MDLPRIALAATASGQGKTTIAVGIMAALTAQGLRVAPAKVGPDYIDPGYHRLATGFPGRNLDPWLCPAHLLPPLLAHGAAQAHADLAVIEGVMGLFDGQLGTGGFASTAHVATAITTPVVLVIDVSSAARTIGATIAGLAGYDPEVRVAGVILNKTGSMRHATEVTRSVEQLGIHVLGQLPRDAGIVAPSRHLGLIPVAERSDARAALDRLTEHVADHIDLDALLDIARQAPPLHADQWTPRSALHDVDPTLRADDEHGKPVIAVAGGRAFTFRYTETEELLRAAGCEPVVFDPAVDRELPSGTAGLYIGGGFPQLHTAALGRNQKLSAQINQATRAGMPTVAECAGLLYLCQSLDGQPMLGSVPADASMHPRLTLGYRTGVTVAESILGPADRAVRGHEFHRTAAHPAHGRPPAWYLATSTPAGAHVGELPRDDGFALDPAGAGRATLVASYLHTHWAGHPELAAAFARSVRDFQPVSISPNPAADAPVTISAARSVTPPDGLPPHGDPLRHHGDAEIGPGLMDFAVNVRLPEPPGWLASALRGGVNDLSAYPNPSAARAALAAQHHVDPSMILPANGGSEAFALIAQALRPRHAVMIHPQFTAPEVALRNAGCRVTAHVLQRSCGFRLDKEKLGADCDLVLVGNPTNPTSVLHPRDAVQRLRPPGGVLVVDEAFMDAIEGEPASLIDPMMPGVLVVRSLTKTWGIAGLRAGYVVGDPDLIRKLAVHQHHWSVNALALAAMVDTSTPAARREADGQLADLRRWRNHLDRGLRRLGLETIPGQAPFVLVRGGCGLRDGLRERGYAVRRGDTFPGLGPEWVRIAVRDPLSTDGLLREIAAVRAVQLRQGA